MPARIPNLERLNRHTESASPHNCNDCGKRFCHESQLRMHLATNHLGGGLPARPADSNEPIVGETPYQDLAAYEQVLDENRETIRSNEINKRQWKRVNREIEPGLSATI